MTSQLAEARARRALRDSGLAFDGILSRASSTHNEIHLSEHHVVRVGARLNQRLNRERLLYRHLPDVAWTPSLVAAGACSGTDYLIVERKPGRPLAHAWPFLTRAGRRRAITELASCMKSVHDTATPSATDVPPLTDVLHPLDTEAEATWRVGPLLDGLDRLAADPHADAGVMASAQEYVATNAHLLADHDTRYLVHGDLTFENVLHHEGAISAVIDYEWCRGAPAELDLDVLLRCCAMPQGHVSADFAPLTRAEDYAEIPGWLADDYPELFSGHGLLERLTLYALAFDVHDSLRQPLPDHRVDVDDLHSYNRLVSLVSSGGHVSLLLERAGLAC